MNNPLPPQLIILIGGLLIPLFKGKLRLVYMLALPLFAFFNYLKLEEGIYWTYSFLSFDLVLGRVDKLSLIFLNVFIVITVIAVIYNSHVKGKMEHFSGFLYAGSAMGVILAGDLITFFIFWELLTVGAAFLILVRKSSRSLGAATRYLLVHVVGGLVLLAGIVLYINENGSADFGHIGLNGISSYFIFFGFGVNCAWPIVHSWLSDTYPESTAGGIIFMATFTTKAAIYALLRGFPGEPSLVWIGVGMATFPIFYAVIENDLRKVLAYSLINQVGFMVVGIGIGTGLSMNGSAAHVYSDILFKGLLFMSVGAVMHQTGKVKATELGGLFKSMPFTGTCCMIGAASISAFPLFSGFVSKSIIMSSAAEGNRPIVWLALLFASAGVFHHAGIKIPFFAFFSHDSGIRVKEAPINMRIAMGITAVGCIAIGIFPDQTIYPLLPFEAPVYEPYTLAHVTGQTLLLLFSALAFTLLLLGGIYPAEIRAINIDSDWIYRKGGKAFYAVMDKSLNYINALAYKSLIAGVTNNLCKMAKEGPTRAMILILTPIWEVSGVSAEQQTDLKKNLRNHVENGVFPIGITAFLSVVLLGILFFF
ncbi:MAG: Na(+)/H(+) antiporter subunit D [Opitutales bacterium]|jgi:multicomponent Na+:H+ antiporter subunit D|nr:Na(+)/H(+) antiporter subunit D [Opitutales bacterium]MDG2255180.1 Na(+)/H(+) antiporter subunit D [Opitutaceae bacterium]MBT5169432.1 Na(+)/H(+) antiporter subunit D [Opitutales bacterium]MBT5815511.1 Na(+)/H(+) antiporter subunit D [Opitutales bacterium]MBT6380240.1 Na(+)/H(+) antiporter subunit D [Opitutales bacterium]